MTLQNLRLECAGITVRVTLKDPLKLTSPPKGLFKANVNKMMKRIIQMNITWFKIQTGRRQNRWLFSSVAEESTSVYREKFTS